jgi:glycerol uptake facilitator-like aquaporin
MTAGEIFPASGEIVLNKDQVISRMEAATSLTTEAASMPSLAQRLFSEWIGTAFLLAAVVGSGIMAAKLAGDNGAVALLCNTLATGAIWVVLILVFGPVSGAHLNPAVSLAFALRGAVPWRDAAFYIPAQIMGGIVGVWAVHGMFGLPLWQFSVMTRTGTGQWLAEAVGTFGLILTIFGCLARTPSAIPFAVGLYVMSASWFTASGSFANPAVTIARSLSDTFAGIAPAGVAAFIVAQAAGMLLAVAVAVWLWPYQQVWGQTCCDGRSKL